MTDQAIPHPPWRIPFIGDVIGIDSLRPNQKTLEQFKRLGPIYRRSIIGAGDLTFVGSSALASQTLDEARWERFAGRPIKRLRDIAGDGLFTADNDSAEWQTGHEVLASGFTQEAMRRYHDDMLATSEELTKALGEDHPHQSSVETITNRAALDVIGKCGFGFPFWESDLSDQFADALKGALAFTQSASIPVVGAGIERKKRAQFDRDVAVLHQIITDVMDRRRRGAADSPRDLLEVMMESKQLSDRAIRDQIITFLIAGHETTGNLLAFALFYLARDSELVEALRSEREESCSDGAILSYDDVARLKITRAVVSETLRLWPTAPGFFRAARETTEVGGVRFEPGEWVFLLMLSIHRDEEVWGPTASQFEHKRFLSKTPRDAVYRPFGAGPRACIGRQFALHEATLLLANLASAFNMAPADNTLTPAVDENLTLRPRVAIEFTPR
ncbi:cytochrome P450 [Gordonia aquimaris]|uniref:Cytochrome P450 n=1 Tax=Gordonia aquimaris TaxID=2984863 RepID=A0A9X3I5Y9_9ACTN|nr:cytochrome P450 [Gordonia aquimaris]MCX2966267.1 cytochrome P450 [Gordonia aquimaris]